jgi:hypothetical protein
MKCYTVQTEYIYKSLGKNKIRSTILSSYPISGYIFAKNKIFIPQMYQHGNIYYETSCDMEEMELTEEHSRG